jgi:hypothetical protein
MALKIGRLPAIEKVLGLAGLQTFYGFPRVKDKRGLGLQLVLDF